MQNKTIIAIDPGASGGFAIRENGKVYTIKMPETHGEITLKTADALLILEWAIRREKA